MLPGQRLPLHMSFTEKDGINLSLMVGVKHETFHNVPPQFEPF